MWIADNPEAYIGQRVGSGQCVAYVQRACGAPLTRHWRRGDKVRGCAGLARGAAIATFGPEGRYMNRVDGSSHAAVFIEERDEGLWCLDQWASHPVSYRLIRFRKVGTAKPVNNGNLFHIIEGAADIA